MKKLFKNKKFLAALYTFMFMLTFALICILIDLFPMVFLVLAISAAFVMVVANVYAAFKEYLNEN